MSSFGETDNEENDNTKVVPNEADTFAVPPTVTKSSAREVVNTLTQEGHRSSPPVDAKFGGLNKVG